MTHISDFYEQKKFKHIFHFCFVSNDADIMCFSFFKLAIKPQQQDLAMSYAKQKYIFFTWHFVSHILRLVKHKGDVDAMQAFKTERYIDLYKQK